MHDKPVALVTGANQGIGLQIAKELVARTAPMVTESLGRGYPGYKKGSFHEQVR